MQEYKRMNNLYLQTVHAVVARFPAVLPYLNEKAIKMFKAANSLSAINKKYHDAITQALVNYFEGGNLAASRNIFKKAMTEASLDAFESGWQDNDGELPIDEDALAWLGDFQNEQFGYVDDLFQQMRDLRKDKEFDYFAWASARADGYTEAMTAVYNAAAMLVKKQMLTWHYGDTQHCSTCEDLNGQRHRASWYLSRDYVPRKPGANLECHGFRCQCYLTDDNGDTITL